MLERKSFSKIKLKVICFFVNIIRAHSCSLKKKILGAGSLEVAKMVECLSGKNENLGSDSQHPHRSWAAAGVGWPSHSVSWLNSARVLVSETK